MLYCLRKVTLVEVNGPDLGDRVAGGGTSGPVRVAVGPDVEEVLHRLLGDLEERKQNQRSDREGSRYG